MTSDARNGLIEEQAEMLDSLAAIVKANSGPHIQFDDLVQAGNLALLELAERYQSERGQFRHWAKQIVWRAMRDYRRKHSTHLHDDLESASELPSVAPSHEHVLIEHQKRQTVRGILIQMPAPQRKVLIGLHEDHRSQQQLADQMGISQGRVSQINRRASDRFREKLAMMKAVA